MTRLLILFATMALTLIAHGDDNPPAPPVTDPAAVQQHYRQVVSQPQFHENEETLADLRWSDLLSQWLTRLVSRFQDFQYAGQLSGAARVLVVFITALAVAGLIYLLVRISRRRRECAAEEAESPEPGKAFLSPRQYEQRLRRALEDNDWHGAWLAAWLQFLARLENRRLVEADRSRTNREYLAQLHRQPLPSAALPLLARLVDDYDRFIYGLRPIDEAGWSAFRERIDEITLMLGLRERATEEPA